MYRISKGIKKPTISVKQEREVRELVKDLEVVYEKAIRVTYEKEDGRQSS